MAININNSLKNNSPNANDYFYCQPNSSTPWATISDAHNGMPISYRGIGKKFLVISDIDGVGPEEFWYSTGITLTDIKPVIPRVYIQGVITGDGTIDNPIIIGGSGGGTPTLPTAASPTNGVVNDTANTYDWTNATGYTSLSEYEQSINGSAYTTVTAKPIQIGNIAVAIGQVKIRVKAVPGVSYASAVLSNTTAFTVAGGGTDLGTPVTTTTYNNGGEILNTNDFHLITGNTDANIAVGMKLNEGVSGWMSQKYTGFAESGEATTAVMSFGVGLDPFYGGINDSLIKMSSSASGTIYGYYNLGTSFSDGNKITLNAIMRGRFDATTGYIEYSTDAGSTYTVLHSFPRPAGVIRVKISMVGDQRFARDVRQSGFVTA